MRKNIFLRFTSLFLCLLMISGLLLFTGCSQADNSVSSRINELYTKKMQLSYSIDKCKNELENLTITKAGLFFVFEELNEGLLEIALPALMDTDTLVAIVSITPDKALNSDIYKKLQEADWEFAIGFEKGFSFPEDDEEACKVLDQYIKQYKDHRPDIISFSSGNAAYRRCFDKVISDNGISVIIAPKIFLAGGNMYLEYDHEMGLLKIASTTFSMKNKVEPVMKSSINEKNLLALSISELVDENLPANSDSLSLERFNLMLEALESYTNVFYGKAMEYKSYVAGQYHNNIDKYNEIFERIDEYTSSMKEIEEEIETLMRGEADT